MLITPENHLKRRNGTQKIVTCVGNMGTNLLTVIAKMAARKKMMTSKRTTISEENKNVSTVTKSDTWHGNAPTKTICDWSAQLEIHQTMTRPSRIMRDEDKQCNSNSDHESYEACKYVNLVNIANGDYNEEWLVDSGATVNAM
jgi:hypothetical protein